ncbi:MAG: DivIVA domain-containing protein [Fimbriimonadaceae bacterium]
MERLTPLDLERFEFKMTLRGCDPAQVKQLVDRAAVEMTALLAEIKQLSEDNRRLHSQVEQYQAQESALKEALILAQKAADETRASAHRQADTILAEARKSAIDMHKDAKLNLIELQRQYDELVSEKNRYLRGIRALAESHLKDLDNWEQKNPEKPLISDAMPFLNAKADDYSGEREISPTVKLDEVFEETYEPDEDAEEDAANSDSTTT